MTKEECLNCEFAAWTMDTLVCSNEKSTEYLHYVMPDDGCDEFERYPGAGDADKMGAIA